MLIYLVKIAMSVAVILASAEAAKRSPTLGAFIVALPLISLLSMTWLYWDTKDAEKVSAYAREIFFLVPVSLLFFLPFLLEPRSQWPYWLNFSSGFVTMGLGFAAIGYWRSH
jgi:TRAP-type mannitol/chloroaromatic compound transport system permease large subunit